MDDFADGGVSVYAARARVWVVCCCGYMTLFNENRRYFCYFVIRMLYYSYLEGFKSTRLLLQITQRVKLIKQSDDFIQTRAYICIACCVHDFHRAKCPVYDIVP